MKLELLCMTSVLSLVMLASEMFRRSMLIEGVCMLVGAVCAAIIYYIEDK